MCDLTFGGISRDTFDIDCVGRVFGYVEKVYREDFLNGVSEQPICLTL